MDLSRRQLFIYLALALVVVVVGLRFVMPKHSPDDGASALSLAAVSAPSPVAAASGGPVPSVSPSAARVVAYVCGAVARAGVYELAVGARVADFIAQAGGATGRADLDGLNLAAVVTDGQQVVVPRRGESGQSDAGAAAATGATPAATSGSSSPAPGAPVNLNTATLEQLDTLPGVGPSTAQKIVDYRTEHGSFGSVDELNNVSGIGDVRFAELKDLVTI
jgi:competence protein ComEA